MPKRRARTTPTSASPAPTKTTYRIRLVFPGGLIGGDFGIVECSNPKHALFELAAEYVQYYRVYRANQDGSAGLVYPADNGIHVKATPVSTEKQ